MSHVQNLRGIEAVARQFLSDVTPQRPASRRTPPAVPSSSQPATTPQPSSPTPDPPAPPEPAIEQTQPPTAFPAPNHPTHTLVFYRHLELPHPDWSALCRHLRIVLPDPDTSLQPSPLDNLDLDFSSAPADLVFITTEKEADIVTTYAALKNLTPHLSHDTLIRLFVHDPSDPDVIPAVFNRIDRAARRFLNLELHLLDHSDPYQSPFTAVPPDKPDPHTYPTALTLTDFPAHDRDLLSCLRRHPDILEQLFPHALPLPLHRLSSPLTDTLTLLDTRSRLHLLVPVLTYQPSRLNQALAAAEECTLNLEQWTEHFPQCRLDPHQPVHLKLLVAKNWDTLDRELRRRSAPAVSFARLTFFHHDGKKALLISP